MDVPRLFVAQPLAAHTQVVLDAEASHYLGRVLRLRAGNIVAIFNGQGAEFHAHVAEFSRNRATVQLGEPMPIARESALRLQILQGLARPEHMDWMVQKTVELGVSRIVPVITARSQGVQTEVLANRARHWRQIAIHACEQCGRAEIPAIADPLPLPTAMALEWPGPRLIAVPNGPASLPMEPLAALSLLIGPEGGFTPAELEIAQTAGFLPISLGPRILRTETAATVLTALCQARWGDLLTAENR